MKLNKLSLEDKKIFEKYLSLERHELAVYAFANIYIWKKLFAIRWLMIEDNLCVFFKDKIGCFLYLPPLGLTKSPKAVQTAFAIMDSFNQNKELSRIENAEAKELNFYQGLGYACESKSEDYLCSRSDLANLKGNKFKAKRAAFNYFIQHYQFKEPVFSLRYQDDCLRLYRLWMQERKLKNQDHVYQAMLKDNFTALKVLLEDYQSLGLAARIVKVEDKVKAFTFGFRLQPEIFCILYEVADLSLKGLSQFIFRQFCRQLAEYSYINMMDDSGLNNLKKVKLSYHPQKLVPAYIVKRE